MSIFFKRSRNQKSPAQERMQDQKQFNISMTGRDFGDLFTCSVALKVWLPESTEKQLEEISAFLEISLSDLLRQILFVHLYGRYDFIGYVERELHTFKEPEDVHHRIKFCLDMPWHHFEAEDAADYERKLEEWLQSQPPIEKQVAATKVFLPERMKADLTALAEKKLIPVSEYCRGVIVSHLMGAAAAVLPESPIKEQEGFV